jgi:AraC-like DNA-binding protein
MFILSISQNILLFISGFGILQDFLLSCLLFFHPKSDRTVNLFLGFYIISISLPMFMPFLQYFFSWQVVSVENFYDLVNGYRVEEAKRLLLDSKSINYTILSVGFEAGFNSKTTFNTVFKKFTGFTPTEFRDKQKEISVLA